MVEKPSKIQPALVGGLIVGLLWSIPFLNLINFCCCLGVMIGGAVAALMLIKRSPVLPVSSGDGAVVGVVAGLIGAGIHLIIGVPIGLLLNQASFSVLKSLFSQMDDPQIRSAMDQALNEAANQGLLERLLAALLWWLILSVFSIGFSTLGGLIGVAIFEKRKGQQPPMAPTGPDYGRPGQPPYGQGPAGY
ncbi:MAG: hypothetical protein AABO41_01585 [Acidobacteriota bacterium]